MKTLTKKQRAARREAQIKRLNRKYQNSTPAQRRVLVARDALEQVRSATYKVKRGIWCEVSHRNGKEVDWSAPLQPFLHAPMTQCTCCGVGSLFLSYVRLNNNATSCDGGSFQSILNKTEWPRQNLRLIELAFEMGGGCIRSNTDAEKRAAAFGTDLQAEASLEKILLNIIKNNGTFKP